MREHGFTIASGDACLDGHFPGAPIVPGVVLLDRIGEAVMHQYGGRMTRIARCKFVAALYPNQACAIALETSAPYRLRFVCSGPHGCVAHGVVEWAEIGDD